MSASTPGHESIISARRIPIAIAISLASLGLIALAFATARKTEPAASVQPSDGSVKKERSESHTPWNLALGDVVFFAPELGLRIKAPPKVEIDPARVGVRIEAQLLSLRQLYRQHSEKDPALLGDLTLRLTVGNGGRVTQVKQLAGQLLDKDFRDAVAAEASKWNFNEVAPEGTVIDCPLLFIREGMDITTVVNWERHVGGDSEELEPSKPAARKAQARKK